MAEVPCPCVAMILVLNLTSGILRLSPRCAGADSRPIRQYRFTLTDGEELLGFLGYEFRGLCRRCVGPQ